MNPTIPDGMGVIIRTAGQGQKFRFFVRDLHYLLEEWKRVQDAINHKKSPVCVFQEPDIIERTVRDFLTEDVERIVVDSKAAYQRIQETIGRISPRSVKKVKLVSGHPGHLRSFWHQSAIAVDALSPGKSQERWLHRD